MQIPPQYLGLWQGEVSFDSIRQESYPCVIGLSKDGGDTIYQLKQHKARGLTKGQLTNPREQAGCIVLNESTPTWKGTLSINLVGEGHLECVWKGDPGYGDSEAVFTRVKPANPKTY